MKLKAWDILIAILQEPQNHQEREALFSILEKCTDCSKNYLSTYTENIKIAGVL